MLQNWRPTLAVALIASVCFLTGLGSGRLFDEDEPKNGVCGMEMFQRGDWIVPTYNNELRTDKPILIYWCMLASFHVFGVSEFSVRLPSALAAIGTLLLTYKIGRAMFDTRTGLVASCLAASGLMFVVLARSATPDSLLIVCIMLSLTSFVAGVTALRDGNFNGNFSGIKMRALLPQPIHELGLPTWSWIGMYVGMGLAVLAKGPIGIVMPTAIIGSYLLFFDRPEVVPSTIRWWKRPFYYFAPSQVWRVVSTLRLTWGIPLTLAVALPWYIAVAIKTDGQWVYGFLLKHNIERFTKPLEHHSGLPIYYPVAIMAGFFPACLFLPVGLWTAGRITWKRESLQPAAAFLLCWIWCYVGFFTLASTKLPNYVVPCYPALALATSYWLTNAMRTAASRDWRLWAGYASLVVAGAGVSIGLLVAANQLFGGAPFIAVPGALALVGGIACLILLARNHVARSVTAFLVSCLMFTSTTMMYVTPRLSMMEDGPILAERIRTFAKPGEEQRVAIFGYSTPTLIYYLQHPVSKLKSPGDFATFFGEGGDAVVMPRAKYEELRDQLPKLAVLAEQSRFLRPRERVVVLGPATDVAQSSQAAQSR